MKKNFVLNLCIIGVSLLIATGCSCHTEQKKREKAAEYGELHARQIVEALPLPDTQLQGRLLDVRSNEQLYRSRGREAEAEAYISAFEAYMRQHCDTLAAALDMN